MDWLAYCHTCSEWKTGAYGTVNIWATDHENWRHHNVDLHPLPKLDEKEDRAARSAA